MKLPTIWRKKRKDKKEYGNCYATVAGDDVNLGSQDRNEARETLRSILIQKAAEASEPDVEDGAADQPGETATSGQGQTPTPAVAPSPAPAPAPIVPDAVITPAPASSEDEARAEADATNQAAAETAGAAAANDNAAAGFALPPEALEGMLQQGATAIVLLQLELQGWIIKKRTGKIVPPLNLEAPGAKMLIEAGAQGWVAQLKIWFPDIELCPPWLIAVGAPLLFLPAQLASAVDAPAEKPAENQAGQPAQAAA